MPGPHAGNRNRPAYSGQPRFRFPKQIIQLFAPRKPLEFKPPPHKHKLRPMTGLADFVDKFSTISTGTTSTPAPSSSAINTEASDFETPAQRRQRVQREKQARVKTLICQARDTWDPKRPVSGSSSNRDSNEDTTTGKELKTETDGDVDMSQADDNNPSKDTTPSDDVTAVEKTKDPYNTVFVWNLPNTTIELRLQDVFEAFGHVRMVVIPKDREGVPRGYGFVEFEVERDVRVAVRQADGMRIDGRRIKVDVERGRTVKGWLPNRLDGPYNSCASSGRRR